MSKFNSRVLVALLTFGIGVLVVSLGIINFNAPSSSLNQIEADKSGLKEVSRPFDLIENSPNEYFRVNENEMRFGIHHKTHSSLENSSLYEQLSELTKLFGKAQKNTFYISKTETDNDEDFWIYVYWKEDKSILTLSPSFDKADETYLPVVYGRRHELDKNIVRTEEEIGNSRKLITKKIAMELIDKCIRNGNRITIGKIK